MSQKFFISAVESETRLDQFLTKQLQLSRNKIEKLIQKQQVLLNHKIATKNGVLLKEKDVIEILPQKSQEEKKSMDFDIPILYEDEDLLVLNKPINLIVHRTNPEDLQYTLHDWLISRGFKLSCLGDIHRQGIIHRLDKTTSGAILIAKNNKSHEILSKQLKTREMGRYYLCVINRPLKEDIIIESPLTRHPKNRLKYITTSPNTPNSKAAKTAFFKIIDNEKIELVGAKLFSGRTHQIRAHLNKIQRNILGDGFYGYKGEYNSRILLHSHLLYFIHPTTQQYLEIYAPLWQDMSDFLLHSFDFSKNHQSFLQDLKFPLSQIYHSRFSQ